MKNQKNNQIDRRTFLSHSAKITATGLVLNKLRAATNKYVSFPGEIKVALVGCGGRGTGAAGQAIAADRDVRLVAVADVFADRAQQCLLSLAEKYGDSEQLAVTEDAVFIGFNAYKKAITMADVVILTTPPGFRPQHFAHAINLSLIHI